MTWLGKEVQVLGTKSSCNLGREGDSSGRARSYDIEILVRLTKYTSCKEATVWAHGKTRPCRAAERAQAAKAMIVKRRLVGRAIRMDVYGSVSGIGDSKQF